MEKQKEKGKIDEEYREKKESLIRDFDFKEERTHEDIIRRIEKEKARWKEMRREREEKEAELERVHWNIGKLKGILEKERNIHFEAEVDTKKKKEILEKQLEEKKIELEKIKEDIEMVQKGRAGSRRAKRPIGDVSEIKQLM